MRYGKLKIAVVGTLGLVLVACASSTKTQMIDIASKGGDRDDTLKSVKCAMQQAGWNITYADKNSVSAGRTFGLDQVPVTLSVRLQEAEDKTTKALFTIHNPRGVNSENYYTRDVVAALSGCGADGSVIKGN